MIVERFVLNYSLSHGKTRINLITLITIDNSTSHTIQR